eukprot:2851797-Prymnesium_polylepis.2
MRSRNQGVTPTLRSHVWASRCAQENRTITHRQVIHDRHVDDVMREQLGQHLLSTSAAAVYKKRQPFHEPKPPETFPPLRVQMAATAAAARERAGYSNYTDYRQRLPALRLRPATQPDPEMMLSMPIQNHGLHGSLQYQHYTCRYKNELSGSWG